VAAQFVARSSRSVGLNNDLEPARFFTPPVRLIWSYLMALTKMLLSVVIQVVSADSFDRSR
jgi:hypothetical protein